MVAPKGALVFGLALLSLATIPLISCSRGNIRIKNNGYSNIVISVGEDVKEDANLVKRIQEVFTEASRRLYGATRNRAYFKDIRILLPETWSRKAEYKVPGTEGVDNSDIVISSESNSVKGRHDVFVNKATGCGQPGQYMYINPRLILDPVSGADIYGPLDKVIVHEWAHLRYGVFDEYPADGKRFYNGENGVVEATRCSKRITGMMFDIKTNTSWCKGKGSLPDSDCRFKVDNIQGKGYGSLMYLPSADFVDEFCDNDLHKPDQLHNPDAPTMQNKLCNGKSVWEVMRSHKDFANNNNPSKAGLNTAPTFTVFQVPVKRYVLVLDISDSMSRNPSHLPNLGRGCSNFILNVVNDGEMVGVVWFDQEAIRAANLTKINARSRQELLMSLPRQTGTTTCIGCGIKEAIAVLKQDTNQTAKSGNIIVVTDGEELERLKPTIADVRPSVLDEGVTIHSIAFTTEGSTNLDAIASETGGLSYVYNEAADSNALHEAFIAIGERNQNIRKRKFPLSSVAQTLPISGTMENSVSIDKTLGYNNEFIFDYTEDDIDVTLTAPSGKQYTKTAKFVTRNTKHGIYTFKFWGGNETGVWKYKVTNIDKRQQKVSATVASKLAPWSKEYPITAHAWWQHRNFSLPIVQGVLGLKQKLFAIVAKGVQPILAANVTAIVERPDKSTITLPMGDSGTGADLQQGDGIYSSYFTSYSDNDRYNVKVLVNSLPATTISAIRVVGSPAPVRDDFNEDDALNGASPDDIPVTNLQRMTAGGSFALEWFIPGVNDRIEPEKVTDLEVVNVDSHNRTVELRWTTPIGEITDYELRYSSNFASMRNNFRSQPIIQNHMLAKGSLSKPKSPGTTESVVVEMPHDAEKTFIFGLLGWQRSGRMSIRSEPSNLVSAGMTLYGVTTTLAPPTTTPTTTTSTTTTTTTKAPTTTKKLSTSAAPKTTATTPKVTQRPTRASRLSTISTTAMPTQKSTKTSTTSRPSTSTVVSRPKTTVGIVTTLSSEVTSSTSGKPISPVRCYPLDCKWLIVIAVAFAVALVAIMIIVFAVTRAIYSSRRNPKVDAATAKVSPAAEDIYALGTVNKGYSKDTPI